MRPQASSHPLQQRPQTSPLSMAAYTFSMFKAMIHSHHSNPLSMAAYTFSICKATIHSHHASLTLADVYNRRHFNNISPWKLKLMETDPALLCHYEGWRSSLTVQYGFATGVCEEYTRLALKNMLNHSSQVSIILLERELHTKQVMRLGAYRCSKSSHPLTQSPLARPARYEPLFWSDSTWQIV